MASSWSKKITVGATWRAMRKTCRTPSSDSPSHLVKISGPSTEMKLTPHSLAMRLGEQGLAGAGRPVEQRADMRRQSARGQQLRIAQRQLDRLLQPLLDGIEPADVAATTRREC